MPKRSSKPSADPNVAAFQAVERLTGNTPASASERKAMAAILGRRGGKKGGKARAANLSAERRSEIARVAAKARWSK
jgi:hypothetical protein